MPAARETLEARARILRAVRGWFEEQGFLEVDTPARVRSPGQEVHLDAVPAGDRHWLITSPEYHMKRLVAAGLPRIVQIGKCWRGGESGPHHRGEFTMVEWYRAGAPLAALADDCEALLRAAAVAAGRDPAALGLAAPFARTTVRELWARHAGIELGGDEDAAALRAKAAAAGVAVGSGRPPGTTSSTRCSSTASSRGWRREGPTFVFDWPAPLAALARPKPDDPRVVERFELYAGGLELANAFGELTDPVEQRRRFEDESRDPRRPRQAGLPDRRGAAGGAPRMPPTSGIALGFDRLVMLVLGARDIARGGRVRRRTRS